MYRKDYILRMLEMLMEMIAAIMGYIKKGELKQASVALDYTYQTLLKEDASFFQAIPVDELTNKLIQEHNYTNSHLQILSELFYAEAEIQFATGNKEKCLELYKKSVLLFDFIENTSKSYSIDGQSKKSLIMERINQIEQNR